MFERRQIDNSTEQGVTTLELTLDDGRVLAGKLAIPVARTVGDVLNGPGDFVDFEPFGAERQFFAKSSIRAARVVSVAKAASLAVRLRDLDGFDPFTVLGVRRDAAWEDIRHAYLALSKSYHPDRYATAELPVEVTDYLSAMVRRINQAFAILDGQRQTARAAQTQRATPIYESRGRP